MEPILQGKNLVKRYGRVTTLDHCDFELKSDEILAVIGDNGAGIVSCGVREVGPLLNDSRLGGVIEGPVVASRGAGRMGATGGSFRCPEVGL